ncbi:unnamed protein product [Brassica rapa]|uniref:Uncharacterized protein n=1 Tax=Brassica campestris TaxID=3711 RepID=A0A8D9M5F9_BRACM|nr:unnamed protein product [Brassica rapa]
MVSLIRDRYPFYKENVHRKSYKGRCRADERGGRCCSPSKEEKKEEKHSCLSLLFNNIICEIVG